MEKIICNKKVLRADDYKCTIRGPVLDGEIITDYGIFIYDEDRFIKRVENKNI